MNDVSTVFVTDQCLGKLGKYLNRGSVLTYLNRHSAQLVFFPNPESDSGYIAAPPTREFYVLVSKPTPPFQGEHANYVATDFPTGLNRDPSGIEKLAPVRTLKVRWMPL